MTPQQMEGATEEGNNTDEILLNSYLSGKANESPRGEISRPSVAEVLAAPDAVETSALGNKKPISGCIENHSSPAGKEGEIPRQQVVEAVLAAPPAAIEASPLISESIDENPAGKEGGPAMNGEPSTSGNVEERNTTKSKCNKTSIKRRPENHLQSEGRTKRRQKVCCKYVWWGRQGWGLTISCS